MGAGDPDVDPTGGVATGLGVATADTETEGVAEAEATPFFIAAILAAISARFCAMRSAVAYEHRLSDNVISTMYVLTDGDRVDPLGVAYPHKEVIDMEQTLLNNIFTLRE